jgi:hypothetical protein
LFVAYAKMDGKAITYGGTERENVVAYSDLVYWRIRLESPNQTTTF